MNFTKLRAKKSILLSQYFQIMTFTKLRAKNSIKIEEVYYLNLSKLQFSLN